MRRSTAPDEIGDIVVKNANDVPVRVRDISDGSGIIGAKLYGSDSERQTCCLDQCQPAAYSNTVDVANEVHQEMQDILPTLPAGVNLKVFYDQSDIVKESIGSVRDAIIIGLSWQVSLSGCSCAIWARLQWPAWWSP